VKRPLATNVTSVMNGVGSGGLDAAGDVITACSAISDLLAQIAAQSGKHITPTQAEALAAEATAIANAIGCP
jgi:hypothetical protein